jgi:hypothetical protein
LLVAVGLLGMAGVARGEKPPSLLARGNEVQVVAPSPAPRTFGTSSSTAHVIGASDFEGVSSTVTYNFDGHRKSASSAVVAWVRLPAGALVESVELEGCDTSAVGQLVFELFRVASPNGTPEDVIPIGTTGIVETPGCSFFSVTPLLQFSPLVIDNDNSTYFLQVITGSGTTSFTAVRVYYRLQVSPAPAVATFSDVPTSHPFFQFIEALARSGITSGCGGGNFCPDAPLTRGQMAVFLSLGLGLHFAP